MKKTSLFAAALFAFMLGSCSQDADIQNPLTSDNEMAVDMSDFYVHTEEDHSLAKRSAHDRSCHSMKVLNQKLQENPGLEKRMREIEESSRRTMALRKGKPGSGGGGGGTPTDDGLGTITIPVYVHVIYSNSQENISDTQIQSQMNVLNADYRKTNSDASLIPAEFAGVAADANIQFTLAGVTRKSSTRTSWGTNDEMKRLSSGGVNPVTPETHLNIWVCNIGGGILGYAQFPGGSLSTDGVVVGPNYFGTTGYVSSPFNKGRTLTHEVGHYLNLRHIWGDGRCRQDDFVADTPSSDAPNYGCPSYPTVNCQSNDMTMNYMDYTDDACMYMFSEGQKARMRSIFADGGARASMR